MSNQLFRRLGTRPSNSIIVRARQLGVVTAAGAVLASCIDGEDAILLDALESDTQALDAPDAGDEVAGEDGEDGVEGAPLSADRGDPPTFVPFEAIVKFRDATPGTARFALLAGGELEELAQGISLVRFASDRSFGQDEVAATWAHIDRLRASDDVEYVQPNWLFKLSRVPNDELYSSQWHYPQVNLPAAWDLTTGSPTVRIAILDTGRTGHPDQSDKWLPGLEYDAVREEGSAASRTKWNHAVAVASIAGGGTNNATGSAGVCWNCRLLAVNVTTGVDYPQPDTAGVIRGIDWAVANGARVINMSFEIGKACSDPAEPNLDLPGLRAAIQHATSNNVTVVAAAGNGGVDVAHTSPASCPGVIAVAATDRNKQLAKYSNFGQVTLAAPGGTGGGVGGKIDVTAQGQGIDCGVDPSSQFSAWTGGIVANWTTSDWATHCDRYISGTSFSAPHVAGVVGLMLSRNPNLTPAKIRQILEDTAQEACDGKCGAGLLDAHAAVRDAAPLPMNNNPKPLPSFTVKCTGLTCSFDASASTDDQSIIAYEWILPGEQLRTGKLVSAFMPGFGTKYAQLRVTDNNGQSSMIGKHFTISQPNVSLVDGQYANPARPDNRLDVFETSDGGLAVTWYTFKADGWPIWYTSGAGLPVGARWTQPLYRTNVKLGISTPTQVGTISLEFSSPTEAWLSWVLDGVPGGERFKYQFGGSGRSGAWFFPGTTHRGISVQESSGKLEANVTLYTHAGDPIWARSPRVTAGGDLTLPMTVYKSGNLCPACVGNGPAVVYNYITGTTRLQIVDGASTSGVGSVNFNSEFGPLWKQPLGPIHLLTAP